MTQPVTAKFGKMLIELGDDATPTVYAAPCGFTSKGVTISKNLQEVNIPDCDDPDAPTWVGRDVLSQSATITGDGVAAAESVPDWDDAPFRYIDWDRARDALVDYRDKISWAGWRWIGPQ